MDKNIVISIKTILATALFGVGIYLIYRLGSILGVLFIALLITISLESAVQWLKTKKLFNKNINRSFAVLLTYLIVFVVLSATITVGFDPVVQQSQKLIQTLIKNKNIISLGDNFNFSFSEVISNFAGGTEVVVSATKSIFSNITTIFSILILSIYLSIDWENIKRKFSGLFPTEYEKKIKKALEEIEQNVGYWLRGQLILMLVIGVVSYIGLIIIGVDFAFPLAILSGLFEIVPIIGPVISAVVAALVAVVDSPVKALLVVAVFALIQNLEGNVIVPKVMQKVSGFSPIIILIALLIGSNLFGIIGAVVAVPVLMIGAIIFKNVVGEKN